MPNNEKQTYQIPISEEYLDFDIEKPLVLLLGNVSHEGITSSLRSGGEQFKQKILDSTPKNWESIVRIFSSFKVSAVVLKLNAGAYSRFADHDYADVGTQLLDAISKVPHTAFVYEDLLSGERTEKSAIKQEAFIRRRVRDPLDEEDLALFSQHFGFDLPDQSTIEATNSLLLKFNIALIPYTRNADLTVMAIQFLEEILDDLLFKIYVPAGRLWANEIDRLLQLFRDYLRMIGRQGVRLDQSRTDRGVSYQFHASDDGGSLPLADEFQEFGRILDMAILDPKMAEAALLSKSVDVQQVGDVLARYAKEARRLQVDLKQDRERKLLHIRQLLETELSEILTESSLQELQSLIDKAIPSASSVTAAYGIESAPMPSEAQYRSLTVNLNPQIIQHASGIVSREIRGDVNLVPDGERLLALIDRHATTRSVELSSALREVADPNISKPERLSSASKLKAFVYSLGPQFRALGVNIFQAYVEQQLGLK